MSLKKPFLMAVGVATLSGACVPSNPDLQRESTEEEPETGVSVVHEAVWSAEGSRLAVTWLRDGGSRLVGLLGPYRDAAPEAATGLPMAEGEAGWASWAPNGLWVAFAAGPEGSRDIHRARPDGSGAEALTQDPADDFDPAYSPDGRTLVFVSTRSGGTPKLHVMSADGGEPRLLADLDGAVRRPMWGPDGRRIAVQVSEGNTEAVYLVAADGGGWGRLGEGELPAWFPDSQRVVFTENDSVFWRPADGGLRRFLVADARAGRPSPDGRWLAFVRGKHPSAALHLLDMEEQVETRITR